MHTPVVLLALVGCAVAQFGGPGGRRPPPGGPGGFGGPGGRGGPGGPPPEVRAAMQSCQTLMTEEARQGLRAAHEACRDSAGGRPDWQQKRQQMDALAASATDVADLTNKVREFLSNKAVEMAAKKEQMKACASQQIPASGAVRDAFECISQNLSQNQPDLESKVQEIVSRLQNRIGGGA